MLTSFGDIADRDYWFVCPYANDKIRSCAAPKRAMVQLEEHLAEHHLEESKSRAPYAQLYTTS